MNELKTRVLLVEDNPEHTEFLAQLLRTANTTPPFELEHIDSLAGGLLRIVRGGIDLILLDLTLPDSEGLETFIRTFEAAPETAIIVLSGVSDVSLAIETVQLGAQDYLVKGHVDNHLLLRSMQYAVERKRVQLQLQRAHAELEARVHERTTALRTANERLQKEILERKRAEEAALLSNRQLAEALTQLRSTQQQIIQRERMHALGRMSNGIAHDFNNSLAPILGFSELLLMKPETFADVAKTRSYIEMIHTAAKDSARVVCRLRDFYRQRDDSEPFTPVVISDLIHAVIELTRPRWRDESLAAGVNIAIRTELRHVPSIPGNEAELRNALVNLIFNSIEAIQRRGTITLRSEVQGPWVVISIADDGTGMTEETRQRCLEPFFSTKGDSSAGLGLGTVYGIIRRHDGEIDIQSERGLGTTVAISLPLERRERAPQASQPPAAAGDSLRILIVDDEPLVREVLSVYLTEDHHEVSVASDGREALEKFREQKFDVIITDRAMPEMNGDALAAEIKKIDPAQPVILLTGYGDLMGSTGEKPEGVDLVVGKPFTLDSLRGAIRKVTSR